MQNSGSHQSDRAGAELPHRGIEDLALAHNVLGLVAPHESAAIRPTRRGGEGAA